MNELQPSPAATMIRVTDYGAGPDSGADAMQAVQRAIAAAAQETGPVIIDFPYGRYDFYPEHAIRAPYYISNTTTEEENPDVTKTFGILLKDMSDVMIEGNGSLLMFHGKMTLIGVIGCDRIEILNLNTDYVRPTMSEMTVEAVGSLTMDVRVHADSWYELEQGSLEWVGQGWRFAHGPAQQYDPSNNTTWRVPNPVTIATKIEELEPGRLRFHFEKPPVAAVGHTFQMRDGIRDQVGAFINESRNVKLKQVGMHFMHGLGIVGQYSENLVFDAITLAPRPNSGRTAAAFADFLHLSGCRGKITVLNSLFEGAHDDPINVHGTHLRVVGRPAPDQLIVRFMHGQSYGFQAFHPGDDIDFVRERSLLVYASNSVKEARLLNPREMLLTLEQPAPDSIEPSDVVENATWTPEVEIRGNRFARIPTRGVLMTTRRKVVIEDNEFDRMAMSGILIADDAASWYESGMVNDVTIRGNRFIACGEPVIGILPENEHIDADTPVHRNIVIESNEFYMKGDHVVQAKSTQGLHFVNNQLEQAASAGKDRDNGRPPIRLQGCTDVVIEGNTFVGRDEDGVTWSDIK